MSCCSLQLKFWQCTKNSVYHSNDTIPYQWGSPAAVLIWRIKFPLPEKARKRWDLEVSGSVSSCCGKRGLTFSRLVKRRCLCFFMGNRNISTKWVSIHKLPLDTHTQIWSGSLLSSDKRSLMVVFYTPSTGKRVPPVGGNQNSFYWWIHDPC